MDFKGTIMQEIKIDSKPFYVKIHTDDKTGELRYDCYMKFTKSRPKQESGFKLFKFTKYYEIIPTEQEKQAFINKYKARQYGEGLKTFYNEVTNSEDYGTKLYGNEIINHIWDYVHFTKIYKSGNDPKEWTITFADHIYIIKFNDGELITDYSKAELRERKEKSEQEAEYKVISNILKESIDAILEKHGMELKDDGIKFKNSSEYYKFVKLSLNNVIDELNKNGYCAKLNPRVRSIKYSSVIVNKKDLRLKN